MEREDTQTRRGTARGELRGRSERAEPDDGGEVMGAYDDVDGVAAYIIAAVDTDGSWIAVPEGTERDPIEWR